nr:MAG TPA: uracil-DNA glycosylase [Caudoviricetes sp.]
METKILYSLKRNSIWLPRRSHGKDYREYHPGVSLEAQDDCDPVATMKRTNGSF